MIYIDSDDVLFDFKGFVLKETGQGYNGIETWKILENIEGLFLKLDVLKGTHVAINKIVRQFGYNNVEVLTALPLLTNKLVTSQVDKVNAIHWHIDECLQVNCVQNWSMKKYFCQSKYDILIDDSERNCKEWEEAGGIAILHTSWESTIERLKTI